MPLLRDISPYSQDIGWLIGLIQDNDADGWLRTKDAIGGFYAEEGREGDDLIPQDHEVAFSYLNTKELNSKKGIQVEINGDLFNCAIIKEPLYDPSGQKMRS